MTKSNKILGVRIDSFSRKELREYCRQKLSGDKFCQVATVNPEFLVYGEHNPDFKDLLNETDLNICDGVGISVLERLFSHKKIQRISGVEVAQTLCEVCAQTGKRVFFLGGYHVADKAAAAMKKMFPSLIVAGTLDGDFETFDEVLSAQPDAILVAFGSPKQEDWLAQKAHKIPSLRIGVGVGGTFDFWSGQVPRAPGWMQRAGLEWLFRLVHQPARWRRIVRATIVFPILFIREKFSKY